MQNSPLVTIVGPGGVGKSRLAIEVADRNSSKYPDGVWWVELLSSTDISGALLAALGIEGLPGMQNDRVLGAALEHLSALIILDNCDQVLTEVATTVSSLLLRCKEIRFLATSREPIGITAEARWLLLGLETKGQAASSIIDEPPDAVRLFVNRALWVDHEFRLSSTNVDAVYDICQQLDGLPLGIELAAARMSTMSASEMRDRLAESSSFLKSTERLGDPRHNSLRSMIQWSYELLPPDQQLALRRLGVFHGGFDLEIALAVVDADLDSLQFESTVDALLAKSLLVRSQREPATRYRQLDTIRDFAMSELAEAGALDETLARLADQMALLGEEAYTHLSSHDQVQWLDRLEAEHDNFRVALTWCCESSAAEVGQRISGAINRFWDLRGYYDEGQEWCRRTLELGGEVRDEVRVRALNGLATLAVLQGDLELAIETCEQSIELARDIGDQDGLAYALQYSGLCAIYAEDPSARQMLTDSIEAARGASNLTTEGLATVLLSHLELTEGRHVQCFANAVRSLELFKKAGDREGIAWSFIGQALYHSFVQDRERAAEVLVGAMENFAQLRAGWGASSAGVLIAQFWLTTGDVAGATKLLSGSEQLRAAIEGVHVPLVADAAEEVEAAARSSLEQSEFSRLWDEGCAGQVVDIIPTLLAASHELRSRVNSEVPGQIAEAQSSSQALLRREGAVWLVSYKDRERRIQHRVGLSHLAALLQTPGREYAALDLATTGNSQQSVAVNSSTGPVLDETAKQQYRQQISDLDADIAEAESWNDDERAEQARSDRRHLLSELGQAVGIGGRSRTSSSDAERARSNVTKAIRAAIEEIRTASDPLGDHLDLSIKTGTFCAYRPDPSSDLEWNITSS